MFHAALRYRILLTFEVLEPLASKKQNISNFQPEFSRFGLSCNQPFRVCNFALCCIQQMLYPALDFFQFAIRSVRVRRNVRFTTMISKKGPEMNDKSNSTSTAVSNRRRSQRVYLQIRVLARFFLLHREWTTEGDTIVVNAHGGIVQLPVAPLGAGDIITLTNPATGQVETCRVVRVEAVLSPGSTPSSGAMNAGLSATHANKAPGDNVPAGFVVAFAFDRPSPDFWAVDFPPTDWIEPLVDH
jgi:hypothetical protein